MRQIVIEFDRDLPITLSAAGAIVADWLSWQSALWTTVQWECVGCLCGLSAGLWLSAGIEAWNRAVARHILGLLETSGYEVVCKETGEVLDMRRLLDTVK